MTGACIRLSSTHIFIRLKHNILIIRTLINLVGLGISIKIGFVGMGAAVVVVVVVDVLVVVVNSNPNSANRFI